MESLIWFLSFVALGAWFIVGVGLLRHPPKRLGSLQVPRPRLSWGVTWILALAFGIWGPALWSQASTSYVDDPTLGPAAETRISVVRTPFAVQRTTIDFGHGQELIRSERRLTMQLPVLLLAFLALAAVARRDPEAGRGAPTPRGGASPGSDDVRDATPGAALIVLLALTGCGEGSVGEGDLPRAERQLVEVTWDTLAHIQVAQEDTLLFSADRVVAAEEGFWVLDRVGHRVAHFDWEGRHLWYAGRRGQGPGELLDPRSLDLDQEGRVWVLDLANHRVTAFGEGGQFADEISLQPADANLHAVAVAPAGGRIFGAVLGDGLHPVSVGSDGSVHEGPRVRVGGVDGPSSIALQGLARSADAGDRWVYAFSGGDGFLRFQGVDPYGDRTPYPEHIPFPGLVVQQEEEGEITTTVRALTEPRFSAGDLHVQDGRVLVRFQGETEYRNRVVDVFEFESGAYRESFLLPRTGRMGIWNDRVVLTWHDPGPEVLVLQRAN
jgi:hypothetical protein